MKQDKYTTSSVSSAKCALGHVLEPFLCRWALHIFYKDGFCVLRGIIIPCVRVWYLCDRRVSACWSDQVHSNCPRHSRKVDDQWYNDIYLAHWGNSHGNCVWGGLEMNAFMSVHSLSTSNIFIFYVSHAFFKSINTLRYKNLKFQHITVIFMRSTSGLSYQSLISYRRDL